MIAHGLSPDHAGFEIVSEFYDQVVQRPSIPGSSGQLRKSLAKASMAARWRLSLSLSASGADPIDARPGFAAMLEHIAGNDARTIRRRWPMSSS